MHASFRRVGFIQFIEGRLRDLIHVRRPWSGGWGGLAVGRKGVMAWLMQIADGCVEEGLVWSAPGPLAGFVMPDEWKGSKEDEEGKAVLVVQSDGCSTV